MNHGSCCRSCRSSILFVVVILSLHSFCRAKVVDQSHAEPAKAFPIFRDIKVLGSRHGHPVDSSGLVHSHHSVTVHPDGATTTFSYNATLQKECLSLDALPGLLAVDGCSSAEDTNSSMEHIALKLTPGAAEVVQQRLRPGTVLMGSAHWNCGNGKRQIAHLIRTVREPLYDTDGGDTIIARVVASREDFGICFEHLSLRLIHEPQKMNKSKNTAIESGLSHGRALKFSSWGGTFGHVWDLFNINYDKYAQRAEKELTPRGMSFVSCRNCYFYMGAGFSVTIEVNWLEVQEFTVKIFGDSRARLQAFVNQPESQATWAKSDAIEFDIIRQNILTLGFSVASVHLGVDIDGSISAEAIANTDDVLRGRFDYNMEANARLEVGLKYTKQNNFERILQATWNFNEEYENTLELGSIDATVRLRTEIHIETYPLYYKITHAIIPYVRARVAFGSTRPSWAGACQGWYDPSINIRYGMIGETVGTDVQTPSNWKWGWGWASVDLADKKILDASFSSDKTWIEEADLTTFCLSSKFSSFFDVLAPATQLRLRSGVEISATQLSTLSIALANLLQVPPNRIRVVSQSTSRRKLQSATQYLEVTFAPSITASKSTTELSAELVAAIENPFSPIYAAEFGVSQFVENQYSESAGRATVQLSVKDSSDDVWALCYEDIGWSYKVIYTKSAASHAIRGCDWHVHFFENHVQLQIASTDKCLDAYLIDTASTYTCETLDDDSDDQFFDIKSNGQLISRNTETIGLCLASSSETVSDGSGLGFFECADQHYSGMWTIRAKTSFYSGLDRIPSTSAVSSKYAYTVNPFFGNVAKSQVRFLYMADELRDAGLKSWSYITGVIFRGKNSGGSIVNGLRISYDWLTPDEAQYGVHMGLATRPLTDFHRGSTSYYLSYFSTRDSTRFRTRFRRFPPWDGQRSLLLEIAHDMSTDYNWWDCTDYNSLDKSHCGAQDWVATTTGPDARGGFRHFPASYAGSYPWTGASGDNAKPCSWVCTSDNNDCCAPGDEEATCSGDYLPFYTGNTCWGYTGDYRCCASDTVGGTCDGTKCTSYADDCCAPGDEIATCSDVYKPIYTGLGCAGYDDGDYMCCKDSDWYSTGRYVADIEFEFCLPGFFTDDCNVFCSPSLTCNMHGTCLSDGTCECDSGYSGAGCADVEKHCEPITVIASVDEQNDHYPFHGKITDGSDGIAQNYGHQSSCRWNILLENAKAVKLKVKQFSTEKYFDYLFVGTSVFPDANDPTNTIFSRHAELSGEMDDLAQSDTSITMSFVQSDSALTKQGFSLHFVSDETVNKNGWEMEWEAVYCLPYEVISFKQGWFADNSPIASTDPGRQCKWRVSPISEKVPVALHFSIQVACSGSSGAPIKLAGDEDGDGNLEVLHLLPCDTRVHSLVARASEIELELNSEPGNQATTFNATYESVYCAAFAEPTILSEPSGELSDGSGFAGSGYWLIPGEACAWTIAIPEAKYITWELFTFDISPADTLRVFDGVDDNASEITTFTTTSGVDKLSKMGCRCKESCDDTGWCETMDSCGQADPNNPSKSYDICREYQLMKSTGNSLHVVFAEGTEATTDTRLARRKSSGWLIQYVASYCEGRQIISYHRHQECSQMALPRVHFKHHP